jgi:regulatory protein
MAVRRVPGAARVLDPPRARAVALDLLSRKAWTRRDLSARLVRRGASAALATVVVADLEVRGHVDDRAFALAWVESRAWGRGLGSRRLREELGAKGVARPLVDEALRDAGVLDDEEARARAVALRRVGALKRGTPAEVGRRLHGYLVRRGFPPDVVRRVMRQVSGIAIEDT